MISSVPKKNRPIRIYHTSPRFFFFPKWGFSYHFPIIFPSFPIMFPSFSLVFPSCSHHVPWVFPRKMMAKRRVFPGFSHHFHCPLNGHGTARVSIKGPRKMARSTRRRWRFTTKRSYRRRGGWMEKNDRFFMDN